MASSGTTSQHFLCGDKFVSGDSVQGTTSFSSPLLRAVGGYGPEAMKLLLLRLHFPFAIVPSSLGLLPHQTLAGPRYPAPGEVRFSGSSKMTQSTEPQSALPVFPLLPLQPLRHCLSSGEP